VHGGRDKKYTAEGPLSLVATIAHELGHVILLGGRLLDPKNTVSRSVIGSWSGVLRRERPPSVQSLMLRGNGFSKKKRGGPDISWE